MHPTRTLFAALALLGTLTVGQPAWAWPSELEGTPAVFSTPDVAEGLYLWVTDSDRLLVRVQGDRRYRLTFHLRYGRFYDLRTTGLDQNDRVEYNQDHTTIYVDISGSDVPEGLGFATEGNRIEVTCRTGTGETCSSDEIRFGVDGDHPDDVPFTVSRKD